MMRAFAKSLVKEVVKKLLRPVIDEVLTERIMDRPKLYAVVYKLVSPGGVGISALFERRAEAESYLSDLKQLPSFDTYRLIEVPNPWRSW